MTFPPDFFNGSSILRLRRHKNWFFCAREADARPDRTGLKRANQKELYR